jgi:hypothetical protein
VESLPGSGIDHLLDKTRAGVRRLTPEETQAARQRGALVIDTRTDTQRREQGEIPGAQAARRRSRTQSYLARRTYQQYDGLRTRGVAVRAGTRS